MKVLRTKELYQEVMDIHLLIMLQSKKWFFLRGTRYTVLPALTMDGFIACDIMKGSCSKERFRIFILSQVVSINLYLNLIFICFITIKLILIFYSYL